MVWGGGKSNSQKGKKEIPGGAREISTRYSGHIAFYVLSEKTETLKLDKHLRRFLSKAHLCQGNLTKNIAAEGSSKISCTVHKADLLLR